MADRSISRSRRHFLLAASAGGVGAAIAAKVASPRVATQAAANGARSARPGYRLTPHINNYYRTAKF